jgi:hypothetical protein
MDLLIDLLIDFVSFFRRIFKNKAKTNKIDFKAIETLLSSVDFMCGRVPTDFYLKLHDIYVVERFSDDNQKNSRALQEFKDYVDDLSYDYNQIIGSNFSIELLNRFKYKFEDLANKKFDTPKVKTLLMSYWYQPIRKTRQLIKYRVDIEMINNFEEFHTGIRKIINQKMHKRK